MALHDYRCPACGYILRDLDIPIAIGAKAGAPACPKGCMHPNTHREKDLVPVYDPRTGKTQDMVLWGGLVRLEWIPQVGSMDIRGRAGDLQAFWTTDCYGRAVKVDSLRRLRQIEDESRREHASNPDAQLLNWRDYSNDKSNADASSIATHLDRAMDDQGERLEADPEMARAAMSEDQAEQVAGPDVPFSAGDILGESG